jgi:hypothetical protein
LTSSSVQKLWRWRVRIGSTSGKLFDFCSSPGTSFFEIARAAFICLLNFDSLCRTSTFPPFQNLMDIVIRGVLVIFECFRPDDVVGLLMAIFLRSVVFEEGSTISILLLKSPCKQDNSALRMFHRFCRQYDFRDYNIQRVVLE